MRPLLLPSRPCQRWEREQGRGRERPDSRGPGPGTLSRPLTVGRGFRCQLAGGSGTLGSASATLQARGGGGAQEHTRPWGSRSQGLRGLKGRKPAVPPPPQLGCAWPELATVGEDQSPWPGLWKPLGWPGLSLLSFVEVACWCHNERTPADTRNLPQIPSSQPLAYK